MMIRNLRHSVKDEKPERTVGACGAGSAEEGGARHREVQQSPRGSSIF